MVPHLAAEQGSADAQFGLGIVRLRSSLARCSLSRRTMLCSAALASSVVAMPPVS